MTGNNDFIAMEKGTNKTQSVNNGHEVVREHNEEYLRIQKEEEEKKNESYVYNSTTTTVSNFGRISLLRSGLLVSFSD